MPDDTPNPAAGKRKRRTRKRPPPKVAWHDKPWVLPAVMAGCGVMALLMGVIWWMQRAEIDPLIQAQTGNQEIIESVQEFYKGNYTLLDHNTLQKKGLLPDGLRVRDDANELVSAWGRVELLGTNDQGVTQAPYTHFIIAYQNIPQQVCAQLAAQLMARYPKVWIGQSPPIPVVGELVSSGSDVAAKCQSAPTVSIMGLGQ